MVVAKEPFHARMRLARRISELVRELIVVRTCLPDEGVRSEYKVGVVAKK